MVVSCARLRTSCEPRGNLSMVFSRTVLERRPKVLSILSTNFRLMDSIMTWTMRKPWVTKEI